MLNKFKTLLGHTIIYGLGRYLALFSGVLLVPIYTRIFSTEDYGVIEIITTTISIVSMFANLGIESALNFYYFDIKDERDRKVIVSTSFIFRLIFICLFSAMVAIFAKPISEKFLKLPDKAGYLLIAILSLPMGQMVSFGLNLFRIRFNPTLFCIVSFGNTLFGIILSIYLVVYLRTGIYGVFVANLITGLVFGTVAILLNRKYLAFLFSLNEIKRLLVYGLPLIPCSISWWVLGYLDRLFLVNYSTLAEVGLYSIGSKLSMMLLLVTASFQMAWVPFAYSIKDELDAKQIYSRVFTYYLVITTTMALALSIFSREILMVFATPAFVESYRVVGLLAYSVILSGLYYIFVINVNLTGKNFVTSWTTGMAALSNIIMNFLLIPQYGMMGAAISTVIAQAISIYLLFRVSQKYYPVAYEIKKGMWMLVLSGSLIFIGVSYGNILSKAIILLTYILLLFVIKAVGKTEVIAFRNLFMSIKVLRT